MFSCWSTVVRGLQLKTQSQRNWTYMWYMWKPCIYLGFFGLPVVCQICEFHEWMAWCCLYLRFFEILKENNDVLLMHFWNYIILMHFRCSFIGFWCTLDVVSKVHQKCIMFFRVLQIFLQKFAEMLKKHYALLMHWWCAFETTSKVHQNPMKLNQKCIQMM